MGLRLIDTTSARNVIPLPADEVSASEASHEDGRVPEPGKLYCLIMLAFFLHTPHPVFGGCICCAEQWPCTQLRLAYRLLEGF
jgi:hypothetical protein